MCVRVCATDVLAGPSSVWDTLGCDARMHVDETLPLEEDVCVCVCILWPQPLLLCAMLCSGLYSASRCEYA